MADLTIIFDPATLTGDLAIEGADLQQGDDLATAIIISLFSDKRAEPDARLPSDETDRRGFWGDAELGSLLWTLSREKLTQETRARAEQYAREALEWLIDGGVIRGLEIASEFQSRGGGPPDVLALRVTVQRPDQTRTEFRYQYVWEPF